MTDSKPTETELWKGLGGDRLARIITNALVRKYGRDVIDTEFLRKEEYYLTDIPNLGPVAMDRIETYIRPESARVMEELHRIAEAVRKHDETGDPERAHVAEDTLLFRALEIIAEGCSDPIAVAEIALSTQSDDTVRWYA